MTIVNWINSTQEVTGPISNLDLGGNTQTWKADKFVLQPQIFPLQYVWASTHPLLSLKIRFVFYKVEIVMQVCAEN